MNPVRNMLIWAGVVASMLLIQPTVCLTAWLNEQMALPEFLKPVEIWMRTMEDTAQAHLQLFFNNTGLLFALYNLLVMAVMAGVGEEIFFRGALMSALKRRSSSVHAAIWISAIVFSAFHLQFYGFIPRLMLGAYFGYLVYFTGSIYPAILAHFINNAIIVAFMSIPSLKDTSFVTGNIMPGEVSAYVVATVVTLAVLALGAFRFKFRIEN